MLSVSSFSKYHWSGSLCHYWPLQAQLFFRQHSQIGASIMNMLQGGQVFIFQVELLRCMGISFVNLYWSISDFNREIYDLSSSSFMKYCLWIFPVRILKILQIWGTMAIQILRLQQNLQINFWQIDLGKFCE